MKEISPNAGKLVHNDLSFGIYGKFLPKQGIANVCDMGFQKLRLFFSLS